MSSQREARLLTVPQSMFSPNSSWEVAEVGEKE